MTPTVITLTTFTAVALAVAGLWSLISDLFLRERAIIKERFVEKFGGSAEARNRKSPLFKDLSILHSETTRTLPGLRKSFEMIVEQSGLNITLYRLLAASAVCGIVLGAVGLILTDAWFFAALFAVAGVVTPFTYVSSARRSRINRLCKQIPEAFDLMSRAIRAGQTMPGAMQLVANHAKSPISEEFAHCCEQHNLGLPQDVALQDLARRTGVMELKMFVVAMLVQRQAGGNPVEILQGLSDVVRKRTRLYGRVRALTGEGRMQAIVLSILPVVAFVALYFLNRSYAQQLLEHPRLLMGIIVADVLGALWIRRIINFDF